MKKISLLSLFASAVLFADSEMDSLKEQINRLQTQVTQIKKQNESNIQKNLDAKIVAPNSSSSFSQNAYLPDIALILNMSAVARDVKNSDYEDYAIAGFVDSPSKSGEENELPFNKNRGFNFNYGEVAMRSTVDPYFDAFAIFHLHPDAFEIEEAFVRTRALPYGFRIKAGKFKSDFGRINSQHQHSWNFDSQPIIYETLFGVDAISDAGIQTQWVAPTDTYLMLGIEALQGTNDRSFGDTEENNLYVGYLKSSVDIGEDLSILGGLSLAHGKNVTTKSTDVYGADLTLRQQLGSYSAIVWQSEYLDRSKEIETTTDKQAGLYSELIYQIDNNYKVGVRYDAITKNDTDLSDYAGIDTDNLDRYTAMMEYHPFPMSRLRLQYTYDRTKIIDGQRKDINELMLSLNIAAGAHGAHNY